MSADPFTIIETTRRPPRHRHDEPEQYVTITAKCIACERVFTARESGETAKHGTFYRLMQAIQLSCPDEDCGNNAAMPIDRIRAAPTR